MTFGIDYAWGRPGVAALRGAGAGFVFRYLSHDSTGKNLTRGEANELTAAGIDIGVVWEDAADAALQGYGQGRADAQAALAQANACGMPSDRPIFFAVDFDANPGDQGAINAYLDGAAGVLGKGRTGIYGGYWPVSRALAGGHCTWAWQTYAWSGGLWDSRAQLQQYSNEHTLNGVSIDYNRSTVADFGQWRVGWSPHQPPPQEDDDMPNATLAEGHGTITPISLPKGRYHTIGFIADNGLQGLPAAKLRVAIHDGGGHWQVENVEVDSAKGQTVVTFANPAGADGISVQREDEGNVHVGYEVS